MNDDTEKLVLRALHTQAIHNTMMTAAISQLMMCAANRADAKLHRELMAQLKEHLSFCEAATDELSAVVLAKPPQEKPTQTYRLVMSNGESHLFTASGPLEAIVIAGERDAMAVYDTQHDDVPLAMRVATGSVKRH